MKKLIYILLFIPFLLNAATYHVAPSGGNDSNDGAIGTPWATWQKAFNTADAGDTVYFRGGSWYPTTTRDGTSEIVSLRPRDAIGNDGTIENPIIFMAYPDEVPILDCIGVEVAGNFLQGLKIVRAHNIVIKGLHIINVKQYKNEVDIAGIEAASCNNFRIENCVVHDISGKGIFVNPNFRPDLYAEMETFEYDSSFIINCDAYLCADSLIRNAGDTPGNSADGIKCYGTTTDSSRTTMTIRGNRSWNNSDDGFDCSLAGYLIVNNNWSFSNGYLIDGDGTGFKIGGSSVVERPERLVINNISVHNSAGFFALEYAGYNRSVGGYYNNFSYKEDGGGYFFSDNNSEWPEVFLVYRNNISYDVDGFQFSNVYMEYTESNNSWVYVTGYPGYDPNPNFTINDDDFISLDTTQLDDTRKADHSLPDITFGHLVEGSDLIEAGTDVGMSSTPDIGIDWDYLASDAGSSENDILAFSLSMQTGSSTINSSAHTVATEVPHGTNVTALQPTITTSAGSSIVEASGVARDFTSPVNYTVTAEDETEQIWVVTVTISTSQQHPYLIYEGGNIIIDGNGNLIINQ